MKIKLIQAEQILDSRKQPTINCRVVLTNGIAGQASVPSGASVGKHEAVALPASEAIKNVNQAISSKLIGLPITDQEKIDQLMIKLDGTENKSSLGANALLGVSLACCRAAASLQEKPLYQYLNGFFSVSPKLPVPFFNFLNGGRHAPQGPDVQEIMIAPMRAKNFQARMEIGEKIFTALKAIFQEKNWSLELGDEGGLVAKATNNEEALDVLMVAIEKAGLEGQALMALDLAASELYQNGKYVFKKENRELTTPEMISQYQEWLEKYPLFSLEDPLAEDDWSGFTELTKTLGSKVQIIGENL